MDSDDDSDDDVFDTDSSDEEFKFVIKNFSKINKQRVHSPAYIIHNLPWKISAGPELRGSSKTDITKYLGIYLECNGESTSSSWCCLASVELRVVSGNMRVYNSELGKREFLHLYHSRSMSMGFGDFTAWNDVINPKNGFIKDDKITLHVRVYIFSSDIMSWGCLGTKGKLQYSRIIPNEANKSNDIEESVKERFDFVVENFSRLKKDLIFSPQILIHNLPWRIGVQRDSSNEFLVFRLFCDKKSKCSWKFFAQVELTIVSQRIDVEDEVKKLVQFYSAEDNDWGFPDFMAWNDIVDPENGFISNDIVILRASLCVDTHSNATVSCINTKGVAECKEVVTPMNDSPDGIEGMFFVVENFSKIKTTITSRSCTTRSLAWTIHISQRHEKASNSTSEKSLGFFIYSHDEFDEEIPWSCFVHVKMTVISQLPDLDDFSPRLETIVRPYSNNWGFPKFMSWKDITDPSRGYIKNDRIILKAEFFVDIPRGISWDSKQETGFIGLKNQLGTCFMNSLVQALYFLNVLRKTIYQIPTENDYDGRNLVLALQRTFYKLEISDEPVRTADLAKCLRHEGIDIYNSPFNFQNFLYLLFNKLNTIMKDTGVDSPIKHLFEINQEHFNRCLDIDYEVRTSEALQYGIEFYARLYVDLDEWFHLHTLVCDQPTEGDTFDTGVHGLQYVATGTIFTSLPPVLIMTMLRFEYDRYYGCHDKSSIGGCEFYEKLNLNSYLKSPEATPADYTLLTVLAHNGDSENGHYVTFTNPKCEGKWYEFDGDIVSKCSKEVAIQNNGGGPTYNSRNAYMLIYIRNSELKNVLQEVTVHDIPTELRIKFEKEFEAEQVKREEHDRLYITVNVLVDDCFDGHQGCDLFDLTEIPDPLDHERSLIRLFNVKKDTTIDELMILLSELFGRPMDQMRIWPFDKRSNGSYRPTYLNLNAGTDETEKVSDFLTDYDCWNIFLEVPADVGDYRLPMFNKNSQVLLFFKEYNPNIRKFYYCQHGYFDVNSTLAQLVSKLNESAGYPLNTKLTLYKEIAAHSIKQIIVNPITSNKSLKEISADLSTGDIIVFQKNEPNHSGRFLMGIVEYFRTI